MIFSLINLYYQIKKKKKKKKNQTIKSQFYINHASHLKKINWKGKTVFNKNTSKAR